MAYKTEQEISCSNCGDIIDTSFNLPDCQKCGHILENLPLKKDIDYVKTALPRPVATLYGCLVSAPIFIVVLFASLELERFVPKIIPRALLGVIIASLCLIAFNLILNYFINKKTH
jgi:hypothetical protein